MQDFTPIEYIKIAVANAFGLDKETWDTRIAWFDTNDGNFGNMHLDASEPLLMQKALHAYCDAQSGKPTGFIMGLDATASGIQLMACLIGCETTARAVNLIDTGNREDVYSKVAVEMGSDRNTLKKPIMT